MQKVTLNFNNSKTEEILLNISQRKKKPLNNIISDMLESYLKLYYNQNEEKQDKKNTFNPDDYFGMIADADIDIETELQNMRKEWTRDF